MTVPTWLRYAIGVVVVLAAILWYLRGISRMDVR